MTNKWTDQLGKELLNAGALTFLISDEKDPVSWGGEEVYKQKVDMVAFFPQSVRFIELKETEAEHRKGIRFKQVERYYYLMRDVRYKAEFWVYVYWSKYKLITGVKVDRIDNLQVFAITQKDGSIQFWASIGADPKTRIRKPVDCKLKVKV